MDFYSYAAPPPGFDPYAHGLSYGSYENGEYEVITYQTATVRSRQMREDALITAVLCLRRKNVLPAELIEKIVIGTTSWDDWIQILEREDQREKDQKDARRELLRMRQIDEERRYAEKARRAKKQVIVKKKKNKKHVRK